MQSPYPWPILVGSSNKYKQRSYVWKSKLTHSIERFITCYMELSQHKLDTIPYQTLMHSQFMVYWSNLQFHSQNHEEHQTTRLKIKTNSQHRKNYNLLLRVSQMRSRFIRRLTTSYKKYNSKKENRKPTNTMKNTKQLNKGQTSEEFTAKKNLKLLLGDVTYSLGNK